MPMHPEIPKDTDDLDARVDELLRELDGATTRIAQRLREDESDEHFAELNELGEVVIHDEPTEHAPREEEAAAISTQAAAGAENEPAAITENIEEVLQEVSDELESQQDTGSESHSNHGADQGWSPDPDLDALDRELATQEPESAQPADSLGDPQPADDSQSTATDPESAETMRYSAHATETGSELISEQDEAPTIQEMATPKSNRNSQPVVDLQEGQQRDSGIKPHESKSIRVAAIAGGVARRIARPVGERVGRSSEAAAEKLGQTGTQIVVYLSACTAFWGLVLWGFVLMRSPQPSPSAAIAPELVLSEQQAIEATARREAMLDERDRAKRAAASD